MNEWLGNLNVGDKVIVCRHYNKDSVGEVEKFTKTLIKIKGDKGKYKKHNGVASGSEYLKIRYLSKWSQEKQEEMEKNELRASLARKLENLNTKDMTLDQLNQVYRLIESFSEGEI